MDYHVWGTMMEACHKLHPKPKSITELKEALQVIWASLPQEPINKAVNSFTLWLNRRDAQKLMVNSLSTQSDYQTSDKVFTVLF